MLLEVQPPKIRFPFSVEKGVAMLEYLLKRVGGTYNYMALLKLAFFADRYHVRNHARPVSMDDYYAFTYGPAGSMLKNILLEYEAMFEAPSPILRDGYNVKFIPDGANQIDLDQFSKSDLKAMEFSLEHFSGVNNPFTISEITHAYPEWDQYASLFQAKKTAREDINFEDFLKDPDDNHPIFKKWAFVDPFKKLSENERNDLTQEMREFSAMLV